MKKIYWFIIILIISYVIYWLGGKFNSEVVYERELVEKQILLDNLTDKINELKGELINDLKMCESGGASEDTALITFDPHPTNKKVQIASLGNFQFKVSTIQHYYKKFYNKDLTNKEAVLIALDDKKASELASDIIFIDGAVSNWYNCNKKMGLQGQLDIINKIKE